MGKIRRERQKYHTVIGNTPKPITEEEKEKEIELPPAQVAVPATGLFEGLEINYDTLVNQKLPEFDKISIRSIKRGSEKHLKKKDKRRLRHETFLKKIEVVKQTRIEEKAAKRRKKTPVVGDMQLLVDALPTLEELKKESIKKSESKKIQKQTKNRGIQKQKTREKEALKHIQLYRKIIKHPSFKADPFKTILEHVQNTVKLETEKIQNEK